MNQSPIATAADYADAMLIARRAKGLLILLLLVMLALQIALFFMVRTEVIRIKPEAAVAAAATQPTTEPAVTLVTGNEPSPRVVLMLQYLTGLIDFLGIVCVILVATMLVLLVLIMLVGRLIGISHVMAALIGCLLAALLLFPWQAFFADAGVNADKAPFIPGVLYTWSELLRDANFPGEWSSFGILKWARFVGFPLLAFILLLWVHLKSSRGLRLALGEDELPLEQTSSPQE